MHTTACLLLLGAMPLGQVDPLVHEGSISNALRGPARVFATAAGTVLVADPVRNEIVRFDANGVFVGAWSVPEGPLDVALHPDGRYFVSRRDDARVAIYDASFVFAGFLGDGIVTFAEPTDIDIATDTGRIYVADGPADKVYGFESNGALALILGTRGIRPGEFKHPSAIVIDEPRGRLIVADHDNFRVQIFTTAGIFVQRFGYRIKFIIGGGQEGWMPRTLGLEVDQAGRIYVADALMSTVRVFDPTGSELGKVVTYGSAPGDLRTPSDMALSADGLRLYVVSTNTASVEMYETPVFAAMAVQTAKGTNQSRFDAARSRQKRGSPAAAGASVWEGPHMIDEPVICGRCHGITGQPGNHVGLVEGQAAMCSSCHTTAGQALVEPELEWSVADPFGTNPQAVDGRGTSHAWGVAAVNAMADSVGPAPGGEMADYLDNGKIKCTTCHNPHNNTAGFPYLRANNTGDAICKECHAPRNRGPGEGGSHPVGFDYPSAVGEFPDAGTAGLPPLRDGRVECLTCHAPHEASSGDANGGAGDGMLLRGPNDDTFCQTCHTGHTGHTPSGSWQPGCRDCHDVHDPANVNLSLVGSVVHNQTLNSDHPVVFTARTGANSFDDGDPTVNDGICQVCHTATTYHLQDGSGAPHNDGANCTQCHPHDSGFMPVGGSSCIACHSTPRDNGDGIPPGGRPAVVNADGTGGHHLAGGVLTDGDCTTCHDTSQHQQGTVRLWDDPNTPVTAFGVTGDPAQLVGFCLNCHNQVDHPIIHTTGAAWEPVCTQCHEMHDPQNSNLFLVRDVVFNETLAVDKPVVFSALSGPNSFSDGIPPNDGICQVCHTATTYHLEDGSGTPHNVGLDCTQCHVHSAGFLPTGGSCMDCHQTAQGPRRPVVGEFGLASHHLQGALDDADCTVCHEMSQHQQGSVRLWNVDDPTNIAAAVALTGDPMTNATEASKLETFCLACHDADGASGSAPFTDGVMPVEIDATLWSGASHALGGSVGPMTCFGDGETFGCHSTGHGSAKRTLLAPFDASQPPVAGDALREEEGMCYTCHDADGPAASDVESLFALAHRHNVSSLDQVDGSRVECTSCHNPHAASSAALLKHPDTGAVWTGTGADFCLTCHDGAPPAGVAFPAGSTGTGYDKSAFGGTTHASTLGPDSCRSCHDEHGTQFAGMLRNLYVTDDYNPYTAGDGDYAACWACHDEDATIQQNNAFNDLHRKHVRGEDAPCISCHDTHAPADAGEQGLINFTFAIDNGFDISYINNNDASTSFWLNGTETTGFCLIRCHSQNHSPKNYNRIDATTVDCLQCHAVAQNNGDGLPPLGRRAMVSEFPLSNAHAHYGAQLDNAACVVCHNIGIHGDGHVELRDPDDGSIYRFVQAGDIASDPDVSDFCANCHDADGAARLANPLDPFGGGNLATEVASRFEGTLQWKERYGDFCFPDEGTLRGVNSHHDISDADQSFSGAKLECLNCHGAHTSAATQPNVDPFNPVTPWTGDGNGFCVSCHGGGTGPLDPGMPPGVVGPVIDVNDPGWSEMGVDWTTILGGACMTSDCSSLRGIDSCDFTGVPWYVDYSWSNSHHGPDSKRGWNGYSGAPTASMECKDCHDPHGSNTPANPAGNPYMIRDFVDGTIYVDDGTRSGGFNGPPWNTTGSAREVAVAASGLIVDWGGTTGLCNTCHASWVAANTTSHESCTSCQVCHAHGASWGGTDWVDFNDDTPCGAVAASTWGTPSRGGDGVGRSAVLPLHGGESQQVLRVDRATGDVAGGE
jgi:predicted CXXCH cytochrome family protein